MPEPAVHAPAVPAAAVPARAAAGPTLPPWVAIVFALVIAAAYIGTLAHAPLSEPDEARYAEIAREMIVLHDWATPHLNYVEYFEKPPLVYWLTAVDFELFGMNEFVARLWPALCGLLGIAVAYVLGRSMYDRWTGGVAAALLAATPLYFGLSQFLVLDMPLAAFFSVALGSFWLAYTRGGTARSLFVLLFYVALALAVLVKGPVAVVLAGGVIGAFLLVRRDAAALRWTLSPLGIGLGVLIALPWFVLVNHRHPEFFDFFIIKQHFSRFLTPDEHRQPWWFFVPIVLGGMLPWTLFVLLAPRHAVRPAARLLRGRVSVAAQYCLLWSGLVFLFFSASRSKLGTYVLPMFCPLAILAARELRALIAGGRDQVFQRVGLVLLAVAAAVLVAAAVAPEVSDNWTVTQVLPYVYAGAIVLGISGAAARVLARRHALPASLAALLLGTLALQVVAVSGRSVAPQYRSLALALRRMAGPADLVVMYRHYTQGIPFYARRRVVMVGSWGELDFGSRQGDHARFFWNTDAQLLDAWRSRPRVFLVINRSELEPLRAHMQPPPRQVAAEDKKVLVVNFR